MKSTRVLGMWLAIALSGAIGAARLVPNFPGSPILAVTLFAAWILPNRLLALCVPFLGMAVSDIFLGGYDPRLMLVVYGALALPVLAKPFLGATLSPVRIGACTAVCAVGHFCLSMSRFGF